MAVPGRNTIDHLQHAPIRVKTYYVANVVTKEVYHSGVMSKSHAENLAARQTKRGNPSVVEALGG